jgi:hypothetical protein
MRRDAVCAVTPIGSSGRDVNGPEIVASCQRDSARRAHLFRALRSFAGISDPSDVADDKAADEMKPPTTSTGRSA